MANDPFTREYMRKRDRRIELPDDISESYDKARNLDMFVSLNPYNEIAGTFTVQERRHLPRSLYESVAAMRRSADRMIRGEPTPEPWPLWTTSPRRF